MTAPSLRRMLAGRPDDPAVRLLADTAFALRADAGFEARAGDFAAGALLGAETPAPLDLDALATTLARIEAAGALDVQAKTRIPTGRWADEIAALPSPLREAALDALDHADWQFMGFGIRRLPLPLPIKGGGFAELMRVEPGAGVADHDHAADELTLIVTGGYHDGHAHYGAGDISLARPDFVHAPKADPDDVCYLLAVTYGPARFQGAFGVVQKVIDLLPTRKAAWG